MLGVRSVPMELFESCAEAVMRLDANDRLEAQNTVARSMLERSVGEQIRAELLSQGRARVGHANGAEVLVEATSMALDGGGRLLLLTPQSRWYAAGAEQMAEVLLTEQDAGRILAALAEIAGRTLEVDRSLIYEVRHREQEAEALCEWLNPAVEVSATKATYPLSAFAGGDAELCRTRSFLESHANAPHPALAADGSAKVLHDAMAIESLMWCPFAFREGGYYALVFNQVSRRRQWLDAERDFLRVATRQVTLALRQIAWLNQRSRTERAIMEAQKLASIRMLAGGVAHDLGGHLSIVLGSIDRMRKLLPDAVPVAELRNAESAATEASRLAKHLLAYSGQGQFVMEPVCVQKTVDDLTNLLQAAAGPVPVDVELDDAPLFAQGDVTQIKQVVMNLVTNGAEASRATNGRVKVTVRRGEPSTSGVPGVVLEVSDTGAGMTPEIREHVLEPFYSTKGEGRGLGLAAVAGIVRAHHGELRIDSTPGQGTRATVSFPGVSPAPAEAPSQKDVAQVALQGTVLVADDMASLRRSTASLIALLGLGVVEAGDGEAVAAMLAAKPEISALVMDWTMAPGGEETLRRAREMRPALPVVVMSGYASEAVRFENDGRTTFLEKPFRLEDLEAALGFALCGPTA